MAFALFTDLDADWRIIAGGRAAQDALRRWAPDPVLGSAVCLDDLLARTARGADPTDADALLRALLGRAQSDEVAARTVLQALVPGLVNVARRVGARESPDLQAEVVAVAWTLIRCGRWDERRGSIASHLLLDVFHVVSRIPQTRLEQLVAPAALARVVPAPEPTEARGPTGREVLEVVALSGKIAAHQLHLVSDAVLDRTPVSVAAHQAGISVKAMTRRRERARASVIRAYALARSA